MTVSTSTSRIEYTGNSSTTVFAYPFRILDDDHIKVILVSSAGAETVQTKTTHYTVSGVGDSGGGNIIMVTAPATGTSLVLQRDMPFTQQTDYQSGDPFPAQTHEDALDQRVMETQQNSAELDRCVKAPEQDATIGLLPKIDDRKNKVLSFDDDGNPVLTLSTVDLGNAIDSVTAGSTSGDFIVNVQDAPYNAVGDDTTDQAAAFALAISAATASGKWLYVPKDTGSYAIDSQVSVTCNIFGDGTIKTTTKISNGRPGVFQFAGHELTIKGLDFDCNSLSSAVSFGAGFNDCVVDGITANDGFRHLITKQGSGAALTYRGEVKNCKLVDSGKVDTEFGDSMYFAGAHDFDIHHNTIDGYTRIGITFEGDTSPSFYSDSPKIHHNTILNGEAVDISVQSSGIWCENCNGSDVSHNTVRSVVNTQADYNARGITRGAFRDGTPSIVKPHITSDNQIEGAYVGMLNPGNGQNNRILDFKTGIYFSSAVERGLFRKIVQKDLYFGSATLDYDGASTGSAKLPNCMLLFNAGHDGDVEIDGMILEYITKDAGETELSDVFFGFSADGSAIGPATTISFDATDNSINDSANGLSALVEGDTFVVSGSTSNDGRHVVKSQTSTSKVIITNETTAVTEAASASITVQPYETLRRLTIKRAKYKEPDERGIVIRNENYRRCRELVIEDSDVHYTLGSLMRFWDSIVFRRCHFIHSSPIDGNIWTDQLVYDDCSGQFSNRLYSSADSTSMEFYMENCKNFSAGSGHSAWEDMTVFMNNNVFKGFTTDIFQSTTGNQVKFIGENNKLINNSGGFLFRSQVGTDIAVFNDNVRDDATAIYLDVTTTLTVTENDTTQI